MRMPARWTIWLVALCAQGLALFGCAPAPERPNVVLIVVDTLRADHTTPYGYARNTTPSLERYFADAEVFENAYASATYTTASVVSMLSGLDPARHGVRDFYQHLSSDVKILPEYLADLGYQTAGIVSNTVLTEEALGIADRFETYDDFVAEKELNRRIYERRASRTTDAALRWLSLEREPDRPHFLFLHYIDPHAPYLPPSDEVDVHFDHEGHFSIADWPAPAYQALPGTTDGLDYVDGYDEEIAYVDREMGRFLAAYEKQGLLNDALVIFTSDHGETLLEHDPPRFTHSDVIWRGALHVPLLVRRPGGTASRTETFVSGVDLTPTILDFVQAQVPTGLQGVPFADRNNDDLILQEAWKSERDPRGGLRLRSGIRRAQKLNFEMREDAIGPLWRADLSKDAVESARARWLPADRETGALLKERIASEREHGAAQGERGRLIRGPKTPAPLDPEQRAALEALGYIQ